jgi:citrate lyase subunit beta/citryl-CoA lyase
MQQPVPRSYLFVPGNRPERFPKAFAAGAHAVIIDLEDAVPSSEKTAARNAAGNWLSQGKPTLVRLNGAATQWFADDLQLCRLPGVAGVVLPKCERLEDIGLVAERNGEKARVLPIIETAQGFGNALALAKAGSVERLIFGAIDLQLDLAMTGEDEELHYFRSQLVLVSRLAGICPPVDGICTAIQDFERLRAQTLRARRFGFGGKLCIHPKQIQVVNESFLPSSEEVAWARRVVDTASRSSGAAVALDGDMVDRPIIAKAEAILSELERSAATPGGKV